MRSKQRAGSDEGTQCVRKWMRREKNCAVSQNQIDLGREGRGERAIQTESGKLVAVLADDILVFPWLAILKFDLALFARCLLAQSQSLFIPHTASETGKRKMHAWCEGVGGSLLICCTTACELLLCGDPCGIRLMAGCRQAHLKRQKRTSLHPSFGYSPFLKPA